MSYFKGVKCIRCGRPLGNDPFYEGCPACKAEGVGVNFTTTYDLTGAKLPGQNGQPGLFRWREFYPLPDDAVPVSIGEGNTPLLKLERLGEKLGIENLYVKDESRNPTMSYKDRLCSVIITKARHDGVPAVTMASTGNHGAAAAAYAAAAGMPCVIFTIPQVPDTMKTLMQAYGAKVIVTPTSLDRWTIMGQCVRELGWMPVSGFMSPAIGSNCYGIDGYKSIAFEIYEQLGNAAPDFISVPACYSDGLYGTYKGMADLVEMGYLEKVPQFVGAEVFGSLEQTIAAGEENPKVVPSDWSISFSIANGQCTWQGLEAVRKSGGYARSSNDKETMDMQLLLASTEGIYAEASSVTSLVALAKLAKEGKIAPGQKAVAVLTSTGLKDPATTREHLPAVPTINPTMDELRAALKDSYGVTI